MENLCFVMKMGMTAVLAGACIDFEGRRSAMLPRASSERKKERLQNKLLKKRIFVFFPFVKPLKPLAAFTLATPQRAIMNANFFKE